MQREVPRSFEPNTWGDGSPISEIGGVGFRVRREATHRHPPAPFRSPGIHAVIIALRQADGLMTRAMAADAAPLVGQPRRTSIVMDHYANTRER